LKINLKFIRLARRLTQKELSGEIGICKSVISKMENNPHSVKRCNLEKVCNFLNVDIKEII
jgi:transcriptional regulator with XRE-family HTH domain